VALGDLARSERFRHERHAAQALGQQHPSAGDGAANAGVVREPRAGRERAIDEETARRSNSASAADSAASSWAAPDRMRATGFESGIVEAGLIHGVSHKGDERPKGEKAPERPKTSDVRRSYTSSITPTRPIPQL